MLSGILITVSAPHHSGKGYVIAAIAQMLSKLGADVEIQHVTGTSNKLDLSEEDLAKRLDKVKVSIIEQTT